MASSGKDEGNFRFNDTDFSDRVLLLQITPALSSSTTEDSNTSEFVATDLKHKKIHINSLMLAYKSQYFYKLFKNGMKETQQKDEVALRINESEETAFMDLLKFIYDHSVKASSAQELVNVLMAADKFEIPSCVQYCVDLLLKLPMSTELAIVYLELPSSVLADEVVQTLIESAKSYLCAHFKDFKKFQDEAMSLPLCAVDLLIGRDGLEVDSEDVVFDFIVKWGRLHYPELEERQEILTRLLLNSICLPKMSDMKLMEVIDFSDFDSEKVMKRVINTLLSTTNYEYPKRVYTHKVEVKVVQFQLARPRCVVYFDLMKDECAGLVPLQRLYSHTFCLGGHKISLFAQCQLGKHRIGLFVRSMEGSETFTLDYDFSVMKKSSKEFTSLFKDTNANFPNTARGWGTRDPFKVSWEEFMSDESEDFIDGILHIRADIALVD